jgi:hypothetical protein
MKKIFTSFLLLFIILANISLGSNAKSALSAHISINESQFLYFGNNIKKNIMVMDSYGNYIKDIPLKMNVKELGSISSCPCGGYILVSDPSSDKVFSIDDTDGNIRHILLVNDPYDVTISKNKIRYEGVIGNNKSSLFIYSENGKLLREISKSKRFDEASSISMDIDNYIWINDKKSGEIIKLDVKGNVISKTRNEDLKYGIDIDSDKYGLIYLITKNRSILKFDKSGKFLKKFNIDIKSYPLSMCIDPTDSFIWIVCEDNSLYKFDINLNLKLKINDILKAEKRKVIYLRIGSRILEKVGFDTIILDAPPFIDRNSDRTLVPIRAISEAFDANVIWNDRERKVTIKLNSTVITLIIGNREAKINGKSVFLDCPPMIINGRTFVPLRFVASAFGATVIWLSEEQKIIISI